jgi:hypothetical protein
MRPSAEERRTSMWAYYDRRIAHREPGPQMVLNYFRGLGVDADLGHINFELRGIEQRLAQLPATTFIDVGAGPSGTFTLQVPGPGIALDQSDGALRHLRTVAPRLPVARGDALHLPVRSKAVGRVFVSHLYGLLLPDERADLLIEAARVSDEIVILDSGRPAGALAEEWQARTLPDGTTYPIYRRHLDLETLLHEVGGEALFDGEYFVMVRTSLPG